MSVLALRRLLDLNRRALVRRVRAQALPLLVLAPLIGGTMLVLLARVSADLKALPRPAATEPVAWAAAALLALAAARRRVGPLLRVDLVAVQPLGTAARRLGGYLGAVGRVLPVVLAGVVMVVVAGGGTARWAGLALLALGVPLLARMIPAGNVRAGRRGWRGRVAAAVAGMVPARLRPHLRRDLTLLLRGGAPGGSVALAGCALGLLAVAACTGITGGAPRPRAGMLVAALAAWAAARVVLSMTRDRWRRCWLEAGAGVRGEDFWGARVALGAVLGLASGLLAALVWLPVSAQAAWHLPPVGLVAGAVTGAAVMEGDGRPLLASLVALLGVVLVTALGTLHIAGLLAVFPVVGYLESLAAPRVERRFQSPAAEV